MAEPLVLTLHVGDYGYAVKLVEGDPNGVVDWDAATFQLLIWTPQPGLVPGPDTRVIEVNSDHVLVDKTAKIIRYLIAPGDLAAPGTYRWQVADVRDGERRVLKIHEFEVAEAIVPTAPLSPVDGASTS